MVVETLTMIIKITKTIEINIILIDIILTIIMMILSYLATLGTNPHSISQDSVKIIEIIKVILKVKITQIKISHLKMTIIFNKMISKINITNYSLKIISET